MNLVTVYRHERTTFESSCTYARAGFLRFYLKLSAIPLIPNTLIAKARSTWAF